MLTLTLSRDQNWISISVRDNGVGIAPENLGRIFEHGFTTKKDGHGFGLRSAEMAAKELGGTIRAESDGVHQGAVFILKLPSGTEANLQSK
jgi:signal transduction histidine kinase